MSWVLAVLLLAFGAVIGFGICAVIAACADDIKEGMRIHKSKTQKHKSKT